MAIRENKEQITNSNIVLVVMNALYPQLAQQGGPSPYNPAVRGLTSSTLMPSLPTPLPQGHTNSFLSFNPFCMLLPRCLSPCYAFLWVSSFPNYLLILLLPLLLSYHCCNKLSQAQWLISYIAEIQKS